MSTWMLPALPLAAAAVVLVLFLMALRRPPTASTAADPVRRRRVELLVTSFSGPPATDREGGRTGWLVRLRPAVPTTTRSVDRSNPPWATRSASYSLAAPADRAPRGA